MKIIIDCDPGVDDLQAIMLALAAEHVEVIAITTVGGNTIVDQTYINTKKILENCSRTDIPVFKGCKINLMGYEPSTDSYFGSDGMCEMNLKYDEIMPEQQLNSAQALLHYVEKYPSEIHLVAIGPLTNLAVAYLNDSSFPQKLASLHVMGGDRSEKTVNNVTPYAEFNCYSDPAAWNLVMNNFKLGGNNKINVIDFKFCGENVLPLEFLNSYYNNPLAENNVNKKALLLKMTYSFMSKKFNSFGDVTADPFSMFVCIYPTYKFTGRTAAIEKIHMEGEMFGHTTFRYDDNGHLFLIDEIDFDSFCRIMLESIN